MFWNVMLVFVSSKKNISKFLVTAVQRWVTNFQYWVTDWQIAMFLVTASQILFLPKWVTISLDVQNIFLIVTNSEKVTDLVCKVK